MSMLKAHLGQQIGCIWLPRGSLWLPMDPTWLLRGCFWEPLELLLAAQRLQMAAHGSIWLLRSCFWVPLGLHVVAQRLHMGAHGATYGCSEAAFGCRGGAFCCTESVYGSHAADMQHMLHLAGQGWAARILRTCQVEASWLLPGP